MGFRFEGSSMIYETAFWILTVVNFICVGVSVLELTE